MRNLKWRYSAMTVLALTLVFGVRTAAAQAEEIPLGTQMPMANLQLQDVAGAQAQLANLRGEQGTVVVFWSNECPWVAKYEDRLVTLANTYMGRGVGFVLVNSNDPVAFPKEGVEESQRRSRAGNYPMRYVVDQGSQLARAFGASRTPHVYAFDGDGTLVYVGTIDDSPGDPGNVQKQYLQDALDAMLSGANIPVAKTKAFGCTIKLSSAGG